MLVRRGSHMAPNRHRVDHLQVLAIGKSLGEALHEPIVCVHPPCSQRISEADQGVELGLITQDSLLLQKGIDLLFCRRKRLQHQFHCRFLGDAIRICVRFTCGSISYVPAATAGICSGRKAFKLLNKRNPRFAGLHRLWVAVCCQRCGAQRYQQASRQQCRQNSFSYRQGKTPFFFCRLAIGPLRLWRSIISILYQPFDQMTRKRRPADIEKIPSALHWGLKFCFN